MQIADEIWHGADILTMDPARPKAEAIAIKDGRILAVGHDTDVLNLAGPGTKLNNMYGRFMMPGLVESHAHALWGACRDLFDVYVGYQASFDQLLEAVATRAKQLPAGDVINGGPWRHEMRQMMGPEPHKLLDAISTDHPIVLNDTSQHILWCNSKALEMGGISKDTPDVPGGVIERTASKEPNGILAETAGATVRKLTARRPDQMAKAAKHFVQYFNSMGITAFKEPMAYEEDLRAYYHADQTGELTLHMAAHLVRQSPMTDAVVPYDQLEILRDTYASKNIRTNFAKLFIDGVALGHTASFIEPYLASSGYDVVSHDPDATLLIAPDLLNKTVTELDARGFTVKMHAVGDNAIRKALDAIQAARTANGESGLRHETAHNSFVSEADLGRFKSLNAIAEMSPKMWFPNASTPGQLAVLGKERLRTAHRIRDLLIAGAEMTYASDWPASAPDANPWTGLSGMITRKNFNAEYEGELNPEQAISLQAALPLFTINGARSLNMEAETGSLVKGKWADFIVLGSALEQSRADTIGGTNVELTVWKGNAVYGTCR